jgi:hypothetical protein
MGTIGRPKVTLQTAIDRQMDRKLRRVGFNKLKEDFDGLNTSIVQVTVSETDASAAGAMTQSGVDSGYDYSTDSPVVVTFGNTSLRIDNIDTFLISLISRVLYLENQCDYLNEQLLLRKVWYTVEYIADSIVSQVVLPHPATELKVYKNGLRLINGSDYDYTFSGDTIVVDGIANDRFVFEYTTDWTGS